MDPQQLRAIEESLGLSFRDRGLLERSFQHASAAISRLDSNERMEFLGDSVLGLIVAERLYERFPALLEGEMTKIKSTVVSRRTCGAIAQALDLPRHLTLGKGMQTGGEIPSSLSAAVFEAVIAAVYLDAGFQAARDFLLPLVDPIIERAARSGHHENFKSVLQQVGQDTLGATPQYRVLDEQGPDHNKCFKVAVEIGGRKFESAWGQSKKLAEQQAALNALRELGLVDTDGALKLPSSVPVSPGSPDGIQP